MAAALCSELSQALDLQANRRSEADFGKLAVGEAGDDRERQDLEVWVLCRSSNCCAQDRRTPTCMDRHHANAELPSGTNRAGHRVGDLVELQVKKDALAALNKFANNSRSFFREQLKTKLV